MFATQFSSFLYWNSCEVNMFTFLFVYFPVSLPLRITSQFLWFNKDIDIDGKCIYFKDFWKESNFVGQLLDL